MLIVSQELVERIDRHRGEMSREEFVSHCLDCALQEETSHQEKQAESELEKFKEEIIGLLEEIPIPAASSVAQEPATSSHSSDEVASKVNSRVEQPLIGGDEEHSGERGSTSFSWLWMPALLFFGFGDTLTSHLVFAAGGTEANPFLSALMHPFGGGTIGFVLAKTAILVALVLLSCFGLKKQGWIIPAVLSVVGGYLVGHNILSLIGLM
jgi:hypothetical protein